MMRSNLKYNKVQGSGLKLPFDPLEQQAKYEQDKKLMRKMKKKIQLYEHQLKILQIDLW